MVPVKQGDKVKVHYTGRLEDGTVFDTSIGKEPIEFVVGEKQLIPGFEAVLVGMMVGETRTQHIPCLEAYGRQRPDMVFNVEKSSLPEGMECKAGMELGLSLPDGGVMPVRVVQFTETEITLDANHPLADKDLIFEIKLMEKSGLV